MLKEIAVDGFSYSFSNPAVNAQVSIIGPTSFTVKAGGKAVCTDGFQIIVSNVTSGPATIPDPVPYPVSFSATATKVKADNKFVLRVDDQTSTINATPQAPGTPPSPSPVSFTVKISNAGQTVVKAE